MCFLQEICQEIYDAFHDCHVNFMTYTEKELSLDENEAGKDIDTISAWLQQFMV